jgi:SAM-dependent methyltransferase
MKPSSARTSLSPKELLEKVTPLNPEEYYALYRVEREHWFYSGKRLIVRHWLERLAFLRREKLLLDVGAGTGLFAEELRPYLKVLAIDLDPHSLGLLRRRENLPLMAGSALYLPLATSSVDVLTALDVLEHLANDRAALVEFLRVVKPGGLVVLTVPALMSLWSEWDVSLHHYRRYTLSQLRHVAEGLDNVEFIHFSYINTLAYFPIFMARRLRALLGSQPTGKRMEDWIPPTLLNNLLRWLFVTPALWQRPLPVGVSALAIIRRLR